MEAIQKITLEICKSVFKNFVKEQLYVWNAMVVTLRQKLSKDNCHTLKPS